MELLVSTLGPVEAGRSGGTDPLYADLADLADLMIGTGIRKGEAIALHDLHHLAASFALAAGVPLPVISKTLRHRTLSTTANIYADHTVLGHPVCRAQRPLAPAPAAARLPAGANRRTVRALADAARRPPCDHQLTQKQKEPALGFPSTGSHNRLHSRDDRI
ncbi:hypothetical protein [Kitasatospora sp. NPDC059803]|uniref:hypothetical protein n=1 Tax=Kitasatospora sp. NPDC059803 TaxID=3346953 RepID=UPI003648861C